MDSLDDFMGSDITDSNGDYSINYAGGHWDPAPHGGTVWRPDIYIVAEVYRDGRWKKVFQSGVQGDVRHSEGVRIDGEAFIAPPQPEEETTFTPGTVWRLINCSRLWVRFKYEDGPWGILLPSFSSSGRFVAHNEVLHLTTQVSYGWTPEGQAWSAPSEFNLTGNDTTIDYKTKKLYGNCLSLSDRHILPY